MTLEPLLRGTATRSGAAKHRITRAFKTVTRATGEQPEYTVGDQVEADGPCPCWKLLDGLDRPPRAVELRVYTTHTRKAVIERNDDLLTPQEVEENHALVTQAIIYELKTWQNFCGFTRQKRREATNLIDTTSMYKWKVKGSKGFIRTRLCQDGVLAL